VLFFAAEDDLDHNPQARKYGGGDQHILVFHPANIKKVVKKKADPKRSAVLSI
jgi:hypothetical protein